MEIVAKTRTFLDNKRLGGTCGRRAEGAEMALVTEELGRLPDPQVKDFGSTPPMLELMNNGMDTIVQMAADESREAIQSPAISKQYPLFLKLSQTSRVVAPAASTAREEGTELIHVVDPLLLANASEQPDMQVNVQTLLD
ncbi:hypothetical protein NDU88_002290 [Pleurodeles waltl]|uniref:Uncharacterized protein n=1 Tax=Pleurodeles waltl TaxID=8319 RepID=A0AAV7W2X7_PLEWA|nr:hypothetical protein NDU88_002290 [Pleurodeles waltl]